jgi:hypothetical protein
MTEYKASNIICFEDNGKWHADYKADGRRFAIHRACCNTKRAAYEYAKECIDYMNYESKLDIARRIINLDFFGTEATPEKVMDDIEKNPYDVIKYLLDAIDNLQA